MSGVSEALRNQLNAAAQQGTVVLDRRTILSRHTLFLFDRLLGSERIEIHDPVIADAENGEGLTVTGRANLLDMERAPVRVELRDLGLELLGLVRQLVHHQRGQAVGGRPRRERHDLGRAVRDLAAGLALEHEQHDQRRTKERRDEANARASEIAERVLERELSHGVFTRLGSMPRSPSEKLATRARAPRVFR